MQRRLVQFILVNIFFILFSINLFAQNPKIKCYFNHPVNNAVATNAKAVFLNGTFPDTIAAYINRAKYTVDIAQYDFTSTAGDVVSKIATAANNAVARGVVVRWIYNGSSTNKGLSQLNASIKTLGSPTTSSYGIMHNKFMVVDANATDTTVPIVLTASYDWSVQQTNSDYNNMVILQNKNLAIAYYNEFNKMWGGTAAAPDTTKSTFGTHKTASTQHIFNVNGTKVELYFSPKDSLGVHLQNTINTVNNELFFAIYTFTDNTIATLINNKFNSGITVNGIIDNYSTTYAAYKTLSPVLGTKMILYNKPPYIYHNKIMLIDAQHPSSDPQVFTGSFNWSNAAETSNDENAIVIHDASIANQYYQSVCDDYFTLGGTACISPMPIDLLYFKGNIQGNNVLLQWACETNQINNTYQLQRSEDGISYSDLDGNNIVTNDNAVHQFSFLDNNNSSALSFYRLKMIDNNAVVTYSNTVIISKDIAAIKVAVYPNPAMSTLHLEIPAGSSLIRIINSIGQTVKSIPVNQSTSMNINVNSLVKGTYTILVNNGTKQYHQLFIKE